MSGEVQCLPVAPAQHLQLRLLLQSSQEAAPLLTTHPQRHWALQAGLPLQQVLSEKNENLTSSDLMQAVCSSSLKLLPAQVLQEKAGESLCEMTAWPPARQPELRFSLAAAGTLNRGAV